MTEKKSIRKFLRESPKASWGSLFAKRPRGHLKQDEEPPPILKTWRNLYILVLGNLLFWIALFTIFTWMFQ